MTRNQLQFGPKGQRMRGDSSVDPDGGAASGRLPTFHCNKRGGGAGEIEDRIPLGALPLSFPLQPPPTPSGSRRGSFPPSQTEFVLVICKHGALPQFAQFQWTETKAPLGSVASLSAPGVGQASWELDQANMGQKDKDKTNQ